MRTSCILNSSPRETYILSQIDQRGHDVAESRVQWLSKPEIKLLIEWIQCVVGCLRFRLRRKNGVLWADLILSLFYRFESTRREKSKNRGSQTNDASVGYQNRLPQHIGIDLIEHIVFFAECRQR